MSDLGDYLRARRAAVPPEYVGLPRGRRRVSGLRREEVAALAGVSVDYYTRLEQGRERNPSAQMVGALAAALDLDRHEHAHLAVLAGIPPAAAVGPEQVHPSLHQLLGQWVNNPAYVVEDTQEIVAQNALGRALHSGFTDADNYARMLFLDEEGPRFFRDWERVGAATVGSLRTAWARPGGRHRLEPVIDELCTRSTDFARLWRGHTVAGKVREAKRLSHPEVGDLTLTFHSFEVAGAEGRHLVVCQAEPGSRSDQALTLLSTRTAHEQEDMRHRAAR